MLAVHVVNVVLVLTLLVLVVVPTLGGTFLVLRPPSSGPGKVAGWQTRYPTFAVIPNFSDFGEHVSFTSREVTEDSFIEEVEAASFPGYMAAYNQLYRMQNQGNAPLEVRVRLLDNPRRRPFSLVTICLFRSGQPYFSKLTEEEKAGSTLVEVSQPQIFREQTEFLIGREVGKVLVTSGDSLVTTPLRQEYSAGERIYPSPIVVDARGIKLGKTHKITLSAGEEAYLTLLVQGKETGESVPHSFTLKFAVEVF